MKCVSSDGLVVGGQVSMVKSSPVSATTIAICLMTCGIAVMAVNRVAGMCLVLGATAWLVSLNVQRQDAARGPGRPAEGPVSRGRRD